MADDDGVDDRITLAERIFRNMGRMKRCMASSTSRTTSAADACGGLSEGLKFTFEHF